MLTDRIVAGKPLPSTVWNIMTESDDDLAKYLVARTVATEPQTVELTFQRPLTPGLLYLLKNTAKDTPIHHLAGRLDPLTTSIYPEKRDYLSLRN